MAYIYKITNLLNNKSYIGKTLKTPEEYSKDINNYKLLIERYISSKNRRDREYGDYLKKWFSEEICDGATYSDKIKWHKLPMSINVYFG